MPAPYDRGREQPLPFLRRSNRLNDSVIVEAKPHKHSDLEDILRNVFASAKLKLRPSDAVSISKNRSSAGGWLFVVTSNHKTISFNKIMRLRAYLTHKFKANKLTFSTVVENGKAKIVYAIEVDKIKPPPKPKAKVTSGIDVRSVLARIQNMPRIGG